MRTSRYSSCFFFLNDPATPELSPLPLPDALPIPARRAKLTLRPSSPPGRATMPQTEHWARTRVRTCRELRRGAWYRVTRATPAEGVLEVSRDRKSTRLNSSHLVISYAVFCLKKKT